MGKISKEKVSKDEIRRGIENGEFMLYFQPQYSLLTKAILGVEVLLRWNCPNKGSVPPSVFIPAAEESQEIYALEKMVFSRALSQMEEWEQLGLELEISINMSGKTLESSHHFAEIEDIITQYNVNFSRIVVEITETALFQNIDLVAVRLDRLKNIGVKTALDDFGTGYSSLIHLKKLPIDVIKIDKNFVELLPKDVRDAAIVKNMISMAHALNCKVVAEGIEKQGQLEFLKDHSCEMGQGYFLSRPMPFERVYKLITRECNTILAARERKSYL